jgi:D-alanyl-D-alanine carboxypeptidase (penicillin-binding protein 5/6)
MSMLTHVVPTGFPPPTLHGRRRQRRLLLAVLVIFALGLGGVVEVGRITHDATRRDYLSAGDWPTQGQAAFTAGPDGIESSPGQQAVPIASIAKVMTAYLVLHIDPLTNGADGFQLTVTDADVTDTAARRRNGESLVAVRAGEVLTERQALAAVLLPSANNVAVMLARKVAGSVDAFVKQMNDAASALGMKQTTYTDPSGYDEHTRSTAADQVVLAQAAMRDPVFASLVATTDYDLPVVGSVHNTDTLLGTDGFVGIKTGSDDAAGGCFMFRTRRMVAGRLTDVTGVVLGQPGPDLIAAGLTAGAQLADRISAGS